MTTEAVVKTSSEAILDDLFSSIGKSKDVDSSEDESESNEEEGEESTVDSSSSSNERHRRRSRDSAERKKKHPKRYKKKHKKKKKKKRRRRRSRSDEDEGNDEDKVESETRQVRRLSGGDDERRSRENGGGRVWHPGDDRTQLNRPDRRDVERRDFERRDHERRDHERRDHERRNHERRRQDEEHLDVEFLDRRRRREGEDDRRRRREERLGHHERHRRVAPPPPPDHLAARERREAFGRHRDDRRTQPPPRRPRSPSRQETRPPVRGLKDEDIFWESTWEAKQVQKRAEDQERKGKHYLDSKRPRRERTPTLSPSPKRKRERSPSPECEELKRLRKLKEIQELVVKDNEKYVAEPLDPKLFEWDNKSKMWRRKVETVAKEYNDEMKQKVEAQFKGDQLSAMEASEEVPENNTSGGVDEEEEPEKKIDSSQLTLDEIEEIRRKRELNKKKKEVEEKKKKREEEEKEDGEVRSDEEEKSNRRRRSRSSSRRRRSRSRSRRRNEYYRRSSRHSPRRDGPRDRDYRRGRNYYRSPSRSPRRRRRPRDGFRDAAPRAAIDKEKLLAIAKRNAVKLLSSDNLMGMDHDRLIAIKSGGQSLRQLTEFCRELAKKGISDELSDHDLGGSSGDEAELHHPFMVKDRPLPGPLAPIVPGSSLSRDGISLERLTPAMKSAAKSHRMLEFPVSSGNAHRIKESTEGTAVPTDADDETEEPPAVSVSTTKSETVENVVNESAPSPTEAETSPTEAEMMNAQNPLGVLMFGGQKEPPKAITMEEELNEEQEIESKPEVDEKQEMEEPQEENDATELPSDAVFDAVEEPQADIGTIVGQRLAAMKKLNENPNDAQALREMYDAQKLMSDWAASKNKPGQFTGHTGAKVLSKGELSSGIQAWAKQEQFTAAKKVSGGFGEFMLKKMGWTHGEGLGKDRSGDVDPLTLDIKMDTKGLMAAEEKTMYGGKRRGKSDVLTMTGMKDLSGKHPVSAIMELATKRHWGPPNFTQVFECGPSHRKQYIFKVTVNGVDYQPTIACDNKKKAKADAATVALREMGMLPKDPNNPL